jgi:hypothetical protein
MREDMCKLRRKTFVRQLLYLVAIALVFRLILVPSAFAQGTVRTAQTTATTQTPLPKSGCPGIGGPAVVLPAAAALLLGSGVLAYAVLRCGGEGSSS